MSRINQTVDSGVRECANEVNKKETTEKGKLRHYRNFQSRLRTGA
jgi:hypothetical protein